jgi:beta-glucosidase
MKFSGAVVVCLLAPALTYAQPEVGYRNSALSIRERVDDLLQRMTLEEKVDQLAGPLGLPSENEPGVKPLFDRLHRLNDVRATASPKERAESRNDLQHYLVEKTRLGIPALFRGEALHGFMAYGSTSFPQALGLASTFDPDLVEEIFSAAADEMAATGVNQAFTPVLDLARDPRWGRTEETYGEDPFLVSRMGVAAIRGLQGTTAAIDRHHVLATAKHFAVHGAPESGTNTAPGNISEREIRETFFVPFHAAVAEAHVGSVMASYNEIDGIPAHINSWLLRRVLRQEWGFRGYVTSDGGGLQSLIETHHVARTKEEAARKAIAAGVDFDLSDGSVYATLLPQVRNGVIGEAEIDHAVGRILAAKFRLGLFENPFVDPEYAAQTTNSWQHQQLARRAAEKSIILLKNDGNLLPLDLQKVKTIAVIGPNAADIHLGGYSHDPGPGNAISILEGIRQRAHGTEILFAEGCQITTGKHGWMEFWQDAVQQPAASSDAEAIEQAVTIARQADVAILVVGENASTNREAWSEHHLGDRDSLDLLGAQNALIDAIAATGKPIVVVLINGRPLSITNVKDRVSAIVEGWYLGEQGGAALAEILFGDLSPGGKLPITFPRSVGQIPDFYNHKPSRNRSYLFTLREPLFPFGFGLSYTTFRFDHARVQPETIHPNGTATLSVEVTNTGSRVGDEVAQLYVHQQVASVTRPVEQLRGFKRITLAPGETATIEFAISFDDLCLLDVDMKRVVEPGTFDLMIGASSVDTITVPLQVIE